MGLLSKDHELRRRPNELAALVGGAFAIFLLGEASGREHAARVVRALPVVRRLLRSRDVPLIARIEADAGYRAVTTRQVAASIHRLHYLRIVEEIARFHQPIFN